MVENELKSKPPYPTTGEMCRLLAGAFDTKSADPVLSKKLDRLARDGDFDWSLRPQIVDGLVLEPLQKLDPNLSDFVDEFVKLLFIEYVSVLSKIPLDALSRQEATPLLIKTLGGGYVAGFLIALRSRFGGPVLTDFLHPDANPIDVVFQWGKTSLGLDVATLAFPDNKQNRDDLGRWRRGDTLPLFGSILTLRRELWERCLDRQTEVSLFCNWLVAARALAWFDREAENAGFGSLIGLVGREILMNCPPRDIGRELSIANNEAGHRLREVAECGGLLLNVNLARTKAKKAGDQKAERQELDRFKDLLDQHDVDGRARYMLDWCEGRWHVLAGGEVQALEFYEKAANQALYRAGENQRQILEEALSLAGHLNNKVAIKRLKHRALAMGLFSGLFAELPEKPDVVSDWEIEQLAQTFDAMFPLQARFLEATKRDTLRRTLPFRALDLTAANKMKPDLANPDRVISIPTLNGTRHRRPQLMWFTSLDRAEDVRRLLNAGADVNISDGQGGSTLLMALEIAESGQGHRVLETLLEWPHDKETLDRLTAKKRMSPLYMAVLLGDPMVVARLCEMGASPDMPAGYPPQTPLYLCVERFAFYRQGRAEVDLMQRMAFPRPEDLEIHRRYSGGSAGVFGDRLSIQSLDNPRHAEIMRQVATHYIREPTQVPQEHLLQIAKILLERGADPNHKHSSPGPGRTPLMVAAEIDAIDAFWLLADAGGDPCLQDDQGNDCLVIAREFKSLNVLAHLEGLAAKD